MNERRWDCKICGWTGLPYPHSGSVDCINQYRALVEDLRSQLPRGRQVMVSTLERDTSAQVWIDGNITFKGLGRLIILIQFMQEAWTEDQKADAATERLTASNTPSTQVAGELSESIAGASLQEN